MAKDKLEKDLWDELVIVAQCECGDIRKITYGKLVELLKRHKIKLPNLNAPLRAIESFCIRKDMPSLTALVVREDTGFPGKGFGKAIKEFDWNLRADNFPTKVSTRWYKEYVQSVYCYEREYGYGKYSRDDYC